MEAACIIHREAELPPEKFRKFAEDLGELCPYLKDSHVDMLGPDWEGDPILGEKCVGFRCGGNLDWDDTGFGVDDNLDDDDYDGGLGNGDNFDAGGISMMAALDDYSRKNTACGVDGLYEYPITYMHEAVQMAIIIAEHHLRGHIRVTSHKWNKGAFGDAIEFVKFHLGYGDDFRIGIP